KETEPPWRLLVCERGAARSRAPLGFELLAHLLIGDLRILDFVDERLSRHHSQVSMFPSVVCDFEQRIGHQLLRAFAVREHPLAAHEKRGLDAVRAQKIDDATLIAGDFGRLLAKIECEGDELLVAGQRDAADDAALRGGGVCGEHALRRGNTRRRPLHPLIAPVVGEVAWHPAGPRPPPRGARGGETKPQQGPWRAPWQGIRSAARENATQRKVSTIPNRLPTRCGAFAAVGGFLSPCCFQTRPAFALGGACRRRVRGANPAMPRCAGHAGLATATASRPE